MLADGLPAAEELQGALVGLETISTLHIVRAELGTKIHVIPAGSNELVSLFGGRVSSQRVTDSGGARFAPLPTRPPPQLSFEFESC